MRRAHRLLLRLRLLPRRALLDRRGFPGRAVAAWLVDPLGHDGDAWRHGAVLRRGGRARPGLVAARAGPGIRPGDWLWPRRIRPRPRAYRAPLEPDRLWASPGRPH